MTEEEKKNQEEKEKSWFVWEGKEFTEEEFCQKITDQVVNHPVVKKYHAKWKELIAWCDEGRQFEIWDENKRALIPVELVRRKKRVVINLMKPLIEALESKINLYYKVAGQPNSSEQKDIRGAEVASRIIDYNDYVNCIEDLFEEMKYDMTRTAQGCIKWIWDTSIWGRGKVKENGDDVPLPGEVMGYVVPIFNIRPDPKAKKMSQARWMIEIADTTKEEIKETFLKYGRITEQEIEDMAEAEEKEKNALYKQNDESGGLTLKIFTERKSSFYEKGRHLIVFGNKVVYASHNKNPKTELGYYLFYIKKSPYSIWGYPPLLYVQPIQREFNRTVSIISEHIEAWRPKMAIGQGALKRAGSMTVDAFELVEVDFSKGDPRPINMPELSQQVMGWRDFLIGQVDRVSNIHEVSYARLPQYASRAPASLYSMMLEQENIKLDPMIKRTNRTIIDMCRFRLWLMDMHYDKKRLTKIMGEGRKASIDYFDRADLNSNFDVRLEIGVTLNQSTTIQQRLLFEAWEKDIIEKNQKNRNRIFQLLNFGTAEQAFRTDIADIEKATRENQAFMDNKYEVSEDAEKNRRGGGVMWLIDDDHEIHLEAHVTLAKSEEAAKWEQKRWEAFFAHIEKHRIAYLSAQQAGAAPETAGQVPLPGPRTVEGGEPMIEGPAAAAAEFV